MTPSIIFVTNPDWSQEREEYCLLPERDLICVSCNTKKDVYKMMDDTPNSFQTDDGVCRKCLENTGAKVEIK